MASKLKSIKGVEVFAAGKWNGDEYSVQDLDEMVRAFEETAKTFRPALKFGHDDAQTLLQRDGHPAAGWVGDLYRKGKKLLADFIDIPEKVYELLQRGAYKKVSSEIYWNAQVGESKYSRLLGGVALLGADLPGVTCLSDIFQMYRCDTGELKCYDLNQSSFTVEISKEDLTEQGDQGMDEKEKEQLEADLTAEKQKNHTLVQDQAAKDQELADLKKYKADAEVKLAESEMAAAEAKLESEVTALVSEKLVTPGMKPYVKAFLGEEKKEYAFGEGKEAKQFSKTGLLKEILKLHSVKTSTVNVDESSVDSKVENEASDNEKAQHEKIEKYAKDNNVSYKVAYKTLVTEKSDESEVDGEEVEG